MARALFPFLHATSRVYAKLAPALAYAAMVARPTKVQRSKLRGAVYQACADRHFATQIAQALFLQKTHLFEPDAICAYFSLTGWHRAFQIPDIAQFVLTHVEDTCRRKTRDKGPLTILSQDLLWLRCRIDTATATVTHTGTGARMSLRKPNTALFCVIASDIVSATNLKPSTPRGRVLPRRMFLLYCSRPNLADHPIWSHCPHVAFDQRACYSRSSWTEYSFSTLACRYCSCADADVKHIAYECPRLNFLRGEWPDQFKERASWPPCLRSCLIATADLPPLTLNSWGTVPKCVAELLETWMAFQRNYDNLHFLDVSPLKLMHFVAPECSQDFPVFFH